MSELILGRDRAEILSGKLIQGKPGDERGLRALQPGRVGRITARTFYNKSILSPSGGDTFVWGTAWVNGTGSGSPALLDGGKFNSIEGLGNQLAVVSASGKGFPVGLTNVLDITYDGDTNVNTQIATTAAQLVTVPATSEFAYYRWFQRYAMAVGAVIGEAHPIHFGNTILYITFNGGDEGSGNVQYEIKWQNNIPAYPNNAYYYGGNGSHLPNNATFCIQLRLERLSSTTAKAVIRVSDIDGANLTGTSSWSQDGTLWSVGDPTITIANAAFQEIVLGNNDPDRVGTGHLYFGAWAYKVSNSSNAWFGPNKDSNEVWT